MQGGNQLIVSVCQRMYKIRFHKHFFFVLRRQGYFLVAAFFADFIVHTHIRSSRSDSILLFLRISDQVGQSVFRVAIIYRKILVGCRRHNVAAILHQAINNTNCVFFLRKMLHIANLFVLTNG